MFSFSLNQHTKRVEMTLYCYKHSWMDFIETRIQYVVSFSDIVDK